MTQNVANGNTLGERIRTARKEKGVTIAQLAKALEVDPRTVNRWQSDDVVPSVVNLTRIAAVVEKPVAYFLEAA